MSCTDEDHIERANQTMAELQPKIKEMIGDTKFELEVSEFLLMPL